MPSLINRYKAHVLKNQFEKSYSALSQAVLLAREDIGVSSFHSYCTTYSDRGYVNSSECFRSIANRLKYSGRICSYDRDKIYTYSKKQQAAMVDIGATATPTLGLPDGTCFDVIVNGYRIGVSIDINGYKKGPNALGHDIFSFWVNDSGVLMPIKTSGYIDDEQLEQMLDECGTDNYRNSPCAAWANQAGYPCSIKSNQKGNGLGCSWYALNNLSPDDKTKGYWENLPK